MDINVIYQDSDICVVYKPYGVIAEESGKAGETALPSLLADQLGGRFFCVHRLDKSTAGLMVYARNEKAAAGLSQAIAEGKTEKEYYAVVEGKPEAEAVLEDILFHDVKKNKSYIAKKAGGYNKKAKLSYRKIGECLLSADKLEERGASLAENSALLSELEKNGNITLSLVRVHLYTGRTHQIRVQFASRKMPLVGDRRYGSSVKNKEIALISCYLSFPHPNSGKAMEFELDIPDFFPFWHN